VRECVPTVSAPVVKVATPPESVPVPRVVPPSLKVTAPVGVPAPGALAATVAVRVMAWPETEGLAVEESAVVVREGFTTWESAEAVALPEKAESPA